MIVRSFLTVTMALGVLITAATGQTGPIRKTPVNSMVIVTHIGEVKQATSYPRDTVHYRIKYANPGPRQVNIVIRDVVDAALTNVKAPTGSFNAVSRTISWRIPRVAAGSRGSVEFEAVASTVKAIRNQATLEVTAGSGILPLRVITNTAVLTVIERPRTGWIPFGPDHKPAAPRSMMKDETTTGTLVNFEVPGMFIREVDVEGTTYHRLRIPGRAALRSLGRPELPIVGQVIEIPFGVNFNIQIVKTREMRLAGYNVIPAQRPPIRQNAQPQKFEIDSVAYKRAVDYPTALAAFTAEDVGVIRGHRLVFLKANPVQYNPVTRQMKVYSQIEARLIFERPAQVTRVKERLRAAPMEALLKDLVLNYKDATRLGRPDTRDEKETGCDYLILAASGLYNANDPNNAIVRLANAKRQKGLRVRVVDTSTITNGTTPDGLRTYLKNGYDNWDIPPTYVLLVGDADMLPAEHRTPHPEPDGPNTGHANIPAATDLYYAALDGDDYFPDLFIGRLSVENTAQADTIVNRILAYESNPPTAPAYYTDSSLVMLFEDKDWQSPTLRGDGREDGTFRIVEFAEAMRDDDGTRQRTPHRIYAHSGNFAQGPQWYEDGTAIPNALTINNFAWNGATNDITTAINNGNFLVTYDGHGGRHGWSLPSFQVADLNNLTSSQSPIVFSWACMTGWFDNEDDSYNGNDVFGTTNSDESFAEMLQRNANGAAAVIASTRVSWDNNDFMMLGAHKAIWPGFNPAPPLRTYTLPQMQMGPLRQLGQILNFSKVYMANVYTSDDTHRKLSFEMYTLFGDPEMTLWTAEPATLAIDYPKGIGSTGHQDFVTRVTNLITHAAVPDAKVVLLNGTVPIMTRYTDPAGVARFTLSNPGTGTLTVSATAANYRPFSGTLQASAAGGGLNRLDPENGPVAQVIRIGGQNFDANENVEVALAGGVPTVASASGGAFGQSGGTDITLTVPSSQPLGLYNVVARGQTSNRYATDVFQVRSANPLDVYLYSQWDASTWQPYPGDHPIWDNPDIQLYDSASGNPVASNNLVVGHQYRIRATIHNSTAFPANGTKVSFKWTGFGLGQPDGTWNVINTVSIDVPANGNAPAEVSWVPPGTGHLCITAQAQHLEDVGQSNNVGQENLHVGPTSSPARVPVEIWNPTDQPAMIHLELRQLIPPGDTEQKLWASWIEQPDPQLIPPGGHARAVVIVDPTPAHVERGQAKFALTGLINGKVIGGANFTITTPKPPSVGP